jgi:hypothetical protein
MKAFHFLKDNMCGGYGDEPPWKIGEERDIGDDNLRLCERGYHSSPSWYDALNYARGNMACIVEVSEPIEKDKTKFVSRKRKLIEARNAEKILRAWGCDCAERALKKAKVTDERSWNAIKIARLFNEGKATKKELNVAWDVARDAAGDAAGNATRTWDAARDAAGAAAGNAARTWDAARDAARDVAWDAARAGAAAWDAEVKWQKRRLNYYMKKLFDRK